MRSFWIITGLFLTMATSQAWSSQEQGEVPAPRALPFTLEALHEGTWAKDGEDKPMAFNGIVMPGLKDEFNKYWSIMLDSKFPSPPAHHTDQHLITGMKCLFDRMKVVLDKNESDERKVELQRFELYQTLAFHKKHLLAFNMGEDVPNVGCSKCVAKAKGEMGMEGHGYDESEENSEGK